MSGKPDLDGGPFALIRSARSMSGAWGGVSLADRPLHRHAILGGEAALDLSPEQSAKRGRKISGRNYPKPESLVERSIPRNVSKGGQGGSAKPGLGRPTQKRFHQGSSDTSASVLRKNIELVKMGVATHHASQREANHRVVGSGGHPETPRSKPFLEVARRSQDVTEDVRKVELGKESGSLPLDLGEPRKVRGHRRTDLVAVLQPQYASERSGHRGASRP